MFDVNIPLTLFAAFIGWKRLPGKADESTRVNFDVRGLVLLGTFLTLLLVGATEFDTRAIVPIVLALAVGGVYWWHAGRTDTPILVAPLPRWSAVRASSTVRYSFSLLAALPSKATCRST